MTVPAICKLPQIDRGLQRRHRHDRQACCRARRTISSSSSSARRAFRFGPGEMFLARRRSQQMPSASRSSGQPIRPYQAVVTQPQRMRPTIPRILAGRRRHTLRRRHGVDHRRRSPRTGGTTAFVFTYLSNATGQAVLVRRTMDGTATAGGALPPERCSVAFSPGAADLGDRRRDGRRDGRARTELHGAPQHPGATIIQDAAIGTILNDNTTAFAITDAAMTEGNTGTAALAFTVSLSNQWPVSVQGPTDGTATVAAALCGAESDLTVIKAIP